MMELGKEKMSIADPTDDFCLRNDGFVNFSAFPIEDACSSFCYGNHEALQHCSQEGFNLFIWDQDDFSLPFLEQDRDDGFGISSLNEVEFDRNSPLRILASALMEENLPSCIQNIEGAAVASGAFADSCIDYDSYGNHCVWSDLLNPLSACQEGELVASLSMMADLDISMEENREQEYAAELFSEFHFPFDLCNLEGAEDEQFLQSFENFVVTPPRSRSNSERSKELKEKLSTKIGAAASLQGFQEEHPPKIINLEDDEKSVEHISFEHISLPDTESLLSQDDFSQNYKRERSISTEVLSKSVAAARKKKQKEKDLFIGRPRGTTLRENPQLEYGLRAIQSVMKDIDMDICNLLMDSEGLHVNQGRQRKGMAQLLTKELMALTTDGRLKPEFVSAIMIAAKMGTEDEVKPVDSVSVRDIVSLKELYLSMLGELESNRSRSQTCLKETVTRFSFLYPTTSIVESKMRILQAIYAKHQALILQCFRKMVLSLSEPLKSNRLPLKLQNENLMSVSSNPVCMMPPAVDLGFASPPIDLLQRAQKFRMENGLDDTSILKTKVYVGVPRNKTLSGARGNLPKAAADDMRSWLLDHFDKPKPNRHEKAAFARKWNITVKQVEDWFVNARARIVKPIAVQLWKELHPDQASDVEAVNFAKAAMS